MMTLSMACTLTRSNKNKKNCSKNCGKDAIQNDSKNHKKENDNRCKLKRADE